MATSTLDLLGGLARSASNSPLISSQNPISSQLTIFYSGTVSVYNDVPADKAHAIMLLLANGDENSRSMDASAVRAIPPSQMMPRAPAGAVNNFMQPLSRASTPPLPPFSASQQERKPQLLGKRTQAELPFARKASLARFLEKRKDRLKQEVSEEEADLGSASKRPKASNDDLSLP